MERLRSKAQDYLNALTNNMAQMGQVSEKKSNTQHPTSILDPAQYPWLPPGYLQLAAKSWVFRTIFLSADFFWIHIDLRKCH